MPRFVDSIQNCNGKNAEMNISSDGADNMKIVTDITGRGPFWTLPHPIFPQWLSRTYS